MPQFSQNSQSFQGQSPWTLPRVLTVPPGAPAEFRKTQSFCKMVVAKSAWEYPCTPLSSNIQSSSGINFMSSSHHDLGVSKDH